MGRMIGPGPFPGVRSPLRSVVWLIRVVIGIAVLIALLALLAAVPGLSLLALGYMVAAEGDVARTGRLRSAFPLLPIATRTGMILVMVGVFMIPIWLLSTLAAARGVIVASSPIAPGPQRTLLTILQIGFFLHLAAAIACGGRLGHFFRPIRNVKRLASGMKDGSWQMAVNRWSDWLMHTFRPLFHLVVAVKAVVGAVIWLFVPTVLLAVGTQPHEHPDGPALISLLGGLLLIPVASWLPLLQAHQAATGRFTAIFEVRTVRRIIARVPLHWALATILLYTSAVPLYLTKVRLPAADAVWLLTPLFVLLIYPTRIMFGWVYARGLRKDRPAAWLLRWPVRILMVPILAVYAGLLFMTPLISEAGRAAMFENHAFLLPIP